MRYFSKISWEESHYTKGEDGNGCGICIYQGKGRSPAWLVPKVQLTTAANIQYVIKEFRKGVPCWKLLTLKAHPIFKSEWRKVS
jgi:hypothetical protein